MRNTPTFIISTADIDLAGWTVSARPIQKHPPGAKQWIESETARRTRPKCPWRREVGLKWRWKNKPRWGQRLKKDQRSLFPVPGDDRQHHGQWSWHPTLRPERGVQVRHLAPLWMSPNCWLQINLFFFRELNLIESQEVFESDFYNKLNTFTLSTSQVIFQFTSLLFTYGRAVSRLKNIQPNISSKWVMEWGEVWNVGYSLNSLVAA